MLAFFLFIFSFQIASAETTAPAKIFRLHLSSEPTQLDPNKQKSSASSYVLGNLFRNIYNYQDKEGLVADLGSSCQWKSNKVLLCQLKKNLQWSDGTALTAEDFLRTYQKILNPESAAPRADILFKIKNALAIYKKQKEMKTLGITAFNKSSLKFEFSELDPDFEYKLASIVLAPTKADLNITSGPYKIKEWKKGQRLVLEPNFKYQGGHPQRPLVEFAFIEEDTVALQLYEKKELHFLRRLPTLFIPTYKERKDFHWMPMLRFDYIGFGPEFTNSEDLRKAFTYSLNYEELQKIFSSEGRPGCAGLPDSWFPEKTPCFDFDLKKVPATKSTTTYNFMFSTLGGEDHKRAAEWMQDQWSKNAHLKTNLIAKENKVFLSELQKNPPPLFRKGVALDRPTCLAALENFGPPNPENYVALKSVEFEKILDQLSKASKKHEQKNLCLAGVQFLMNHHLLIPMGAMHFAILASEEFSGWKLNQMNQLDLSQLHAGP